jgi:hypothetical protein
LNFATAGSGLSSTSHSQPICRITELYYTSLLQDGSVGERQLDLGSIAHRNDHSNPRDGCGDYRVISSDNHVFEPPDLWTSRAKPAFKDRVPQLVHEYDGDWWFCDGHRTIGLAAGTQTGMRFEAPEQMVCFIRVQTSQVVIRP